MLKASNTNDDNLPPPTTLSTTHHLVHLLDLGHLHVCLLSHLVASDQLRVTYCNCPGMPQPH